MKYLIIMIACLCLACKNDQKISKERSFQYKIAYNAVPDLEKEDYEVFIMDIDGNNKKNISKLGGVEWTYYAHNDDIFFISDADTLHRNYFLYSMKPDGSEKQKISDIRLADSWHDGRYDAQELIVRPHASVDTAFYIIDRKGNVLKKLKPEFDMINDPVFSPDGSQIVFRAGNKSKKFERGYDDELYIMDVDGNNIKQLTHFPEGDSLKKWHSYSAGPPRWHPTENFITYQSERNGRYNLYAVTPDGKKNWRLTDNEFSEGWHCWSDDGKYLAIEVFDKEQTQFDIMLMDWDTKTKTLLTDSTMVYEQAPVFVKVYD